jgi:transposase InsO family protein
VGEGSDHRLPHAKSVGGLSAADVHDASRWHRSRQSGGRLAGVEAGGVVIAMEAATLAQGEWFRAAAATAPALDISYINLCGTFYDLCSVLDGFSRFLMHWDLRESMREADVEVILERAKEKYPETKSRIISDNGPQLIARDFKEFIRISGMTHVRTRLATRSRTESWNAGTSR